MKFLFIYLFYMNKVSNIDAHESFRDARYVSLSQMPSRRPCAHKSIFL